ncbi:hypothetical protein [Nonomuraea jabiensis]|uniref:Uncharacterized protein n=1 Tax=Nonomuraea jabiensis TaxID=882448 RepID=A0A7W9FXT5_9ACTN|nr:hypothetical protein [Nonomuraea jabiensis]MBB5773508.1 hypothetical protein [Nonomuraea jabiensis]
MPTKDEVETARRQIERLSDQCEADLRELIRLAEGGALKGPEGDQLSADIRQWERDTKNYFRAALDTLHNLAASEVSP